ncbi:MAG: DUF2236 domain-containing protein [Hymenobacteraceae bacterium]|nr:DUF2236 domain-containing protein [Hymenobacteraceae bacterium]
MDYFVREGSVVRDIWGKSDTILFIFAGASAEFALNKAVDWLYFTGRLPADPLGRLFSTVEYARQIVFSSQTGAHKAIDTMAKIHAGVEAKRGMAIPDWAYRDVLFMLIDYSIRSFELLERELSLAEKEEVFNVFNQVGTRMGLQGLPTSFTSWQLMREKHLKQNMLRSHFTYDLYRQYRKHLGPVRYKLLLEGQKLIVPDLVSEQLQFGKWYLLKPVLWVYKLSRQLRADWFIKALILPPAYKKEISALDSRPA